MMIMYRRIETHQNQRTHKHKQCSERSLEMELPALSGKLWQNDRPTDQQTDQTTDRRTDGLTGELHFHPLKIKGMCQEGVD